eukprot:UN33728
MQEPPTTQTFLPGSDFGGYHGFLMLTMNIMKKIGIPEHTSEKRTLNVLGLLYVQLRDSNIFEDLPSQDDARSDYSNKLFKKRVDTLADALYETILNCDDLDIEVENDTDNGEKSVK